MTGRSLRRRIATKENAENVSLRSNGPHKKLKASTVNPRSPKITMPRNRKNRSPVTEKRKPRLALVDKTNSINIKTIPVAKGPAEPTKDQGLSSSGRIRKREIFKAEIQLPKQKLIRTREVSHGLKNSAVPDFKERNEQSKGGDLVERVRQNDLSLADEGSNLSGTAGSAEDSYQNRNEWDGNKFLGFDDDGPDIKQNMFFEWKDKNKSQVEKTRTFPPTPVTMGSSSFSTKRSERLANFRNPTSPNKDILFGLSRMETTESAKKLSSPKNCQSVVPTCKEKDSLPPAGVPMTRSESKRAILLQEEQFLKPLDGNILRTKNEKVKKAKILKTPVATTAPSVDVKTSPRKTPLFSVFNKSLSPRNYSPQNKIFVSRRPESSGKPQPVYKSKTHTPVRRNKCPPVIENEGMYEFEVDENEPKPKKKHRPILKMQKKRHVTKKRKPNNYVVDPEVEKRVLRNLDMSPSVLETVRPPTQNKPEALGLATVTPGHPSSSSNVSVLESDGHSSSKLHAHVATVASTNNLMMPQTSAEVDKLGGEKFADNACEADDDDHFDPCPQSPCAPTSLLSTPAHRSISSVMNETTNKYGRLPNKFYSPVAANDSPLPVLFANQTPSSKMTPNASSMSRGSHECISGLLGDVGASTPIKQREDDSTITEEHQPLKADVSNCFGFDEPESFEEPLVSPIKRHIIRLNYNRPVAPSPSRTLLEFRRKPPINSPLPSRCVPPVDVKGVIEKLKAEVGQDPNSSDVSVAVFSDDCEKQLPIKHFLQTEPTTRPNDVANESSVVPDDSICQSLPPLRVSYNRPARTKKRKILQDMEYNERSMCHSSDNESNESEDEEEKEEEPKKKKKKVAFKTVKVPSKKKEKGAMNKKEEEELEKWAEQFNSQCAEISGYGLCVE